MEELQYNALNHPVQTDMTNDTSSPLFNQLNHNHIVFLLPQKITKLKIENSFN